MLNLPWFFHPSLHLFSKQVREGGRPLLQLDVVFEHSGPEGWAPEARWYRVGGLRTAVMDLGVHALSALLVMTTGSLDMSSQSISRLSPERSVLEGMLKAGVVIRAEVGWDAVVRPSFVVRATTDNATYSTDLIAEAQAAITGNGLGPYSHFVECHRSRTIPATDIASLRPLLETALRWAEQC